MKLLSSSKQSVILNGALHLIGVRVCVCVCIVKNTTVRDRNIGSIDLYQKN